MSKIKEARIAIAQAKINLQKPRIVEAGFWSTVGDFAKSVLVDLQIMDTVAESVADELNKKPTNIDGAKEVLSAAISKIIDDGDFAKQITKYKNDDITDALVSGMATTITTEVTDQLEKTVKRELTGSGVMFDPEGLPGMIYELLGGSFTTASSLGLIKKAEFDLTTAFGAILLWNFGGKIIKAPVEVIGRVTEVFSSKIASLGVKATESSANEALKQSLEVVFKDKKAMAAITKACTNAKVPVPTLEVLMETTIKNVPKGFFSRIMSVLSKTTPAAAKVVSETAAQTAEVITKKVMSSPKMANIAKLTGKPLAAIAEKLSLGLAGKVLSFALIRKLIPVIGILDLLGNTFTFGEGKSQADWDRVFDKSALRAAVFSALAQEASALTGKSFTDVGTTPAAESPMTTTTPAASTGAAIYEVKGGDTLSGIAKKQLGDMGRWREIFNLNTDQIKNPDKIEIGWKLKMPSGSAKQETQSIPAKEEAKLTPAKNETKPAPAREEAKPTPAKEEVLKDPEFNDWFQQKNKMRATLALSPLSESAAREQYNLEKAKAPANPEVKPEVKEKTPADNLNDSIAEVVNQNNLGKEGSPKEELGKISSHLTTTTDKGSIVEYLQALSSINNEGLLNQVSEQYRRSSGSQRGMMADQILSLNRNYKQYQEGDVAAMNKLTQILKNSGEDFWNSHEQMVLALRKKIFAKAKASGVDVSNMNTNASSILRNLQSTRVLLKTLVKNSAPHASGHGLTPITTPVNNLYTVLPGDSLSVIAKRELGNANRWQEILKLNPVRIKNQNVIQPGWKLKMPQDWKSKETKAQEESAKFLNKEQEKAVQPQPAAPPGRPAPATPTAPASPGGAAFDAFQ